MLFSKLRLAPMVLILLLGLLLIVPLVIAAPTLIAATPTAVPVAAPGRPLRDDVAQEVPAAYPRHISRMSRRLTGGDCIRSVPYSSART